MALLVLLAIVIVAVSWWLVSTLSSNEARAAVRRHNAEVLNAAKQGLIGYVANRVNHPANPLSQREKYPGRLPCPEADGNIGTANEGVAANVCSLPAVGRLPWKTLGLDQLRDASNEPLWYVVSPGWTLPSTTSTIALNPNIGGALNLDSASTPVALIIAPGPALIVENSANCAARTQSRTLPAPGIDYRDYLECQNATTPADTAFVTTGPAGSFNDQVVPVSASDVWSVVEGAVAARYVRDVAPALRGAFGSPYASSQWGSSVAASTPVLPFALSFAGGATAPVQGALPLWRSQGCSVGDPYCDPTFVGWETANPDPSLNPRVVKRGGDAELIGSDHCLAGSSASQVVCDITYGGWCGDALNLGNTLGGVCTLDFEASVLAQANNVARALREFDTSPITGFSALLSYGTPLASTGNANADIRGQLAPVSCNLTIIFGLLFPCYASTSVTVAIPIDVFRDTPALTALFTTGTDWEWFFQNRWYDVFYYAVSPSHVPGAAVHDCRANADCLTVAGGTMPGNVRGLVSMMGYSLSGMARPNSTLADYLDSTQNTDGDIAFEQQLSGRRFNDRFFDVSRY